MTTPTDAAEGIQRLSVANIAAMRSSFLSRWVAKIATYGEVLLDEALEPFGARSPAVMIVPPEIGPGLAESAIGCPVNWAWRPQDKLRTHWQPNGPGKFLTGFHHEIYSGVVERAWADERGVNAVLGIFRPDCHDDLDALERNDALAFSGICLVQRADFTLSTSPWRITVARIVSARAISCDFNSLPLLKGSHIVRRLALDEDPDERESIETEHRLIPASWRGATMTPAPETDTTIGGGTVGGTAIGSNQVSTTHRQDVNSATHSQAWPADLTNAVKSREYSVSVSIEEDYLGQWWVDVPAIASFSTTQAYGLLPVVQGTSNAKAWISTTLPTASTPNVVAEFFYW